MKLPTTSDGGGSGDGVNLPPLAQSTPQPSRATRHRIVADIDVPPAAGSEGPPASIPNDSLPHWELGYHVSERCAACQLNPTNIDDENPDPPGPSLGQGSQLEINPFGPTLSQGQVQYQSVGIQAGDPESTTHEDYLEAETSIYYTAINDSTVVPNAAGASFGGQPSLQVTPPNSPRARYFNFRHIRPLNLSVISTLRWLQQRGG
ncbi:hypothetical protein FRC04_006228 [Tulasnella sp. 424]|nr:hypothetical protein FRC04_006228 [Tulasnella sp. 424]